MMHTLYTIGHSSRSAEELIDILRRHSIASVGDVRSAPYSKYSPQFDCSVIADNLKRNGIKYIYMGRELGGRPDDSSCYVNGQVDYGLVRKSDFFKRGMRQLERELCRHRLALMCSEKDPLNCHRMLLVCRHVRSASIAIQHIFDAETVETNAEAERRLLQTVGLPEADLFSDFDELIETAYDLQARKAAYKERKERAIT